MSVFVCSCSPGSFERVLLGWRTILSPYPPPLPFDPLWQHFTFPSPNPPPAAPSLLEPFKKKEKRLLWFDKETGPPGVLHVHCEDVQRRERREEEKVFSPSPRSSRRRQRRRKGKSIQVVVNKLRGRCTVDLFSLSPPYFFKIYPLSF